LSRAFVPNSLGDGSDGFGQVVNVMRVDASHRKAAILSAVDAELFLQPRHLHSTKR
jgi:hypothetical protein